MIPGVHRPAAGSSWFGIAALTAAVAAAAGALVVNSPPLALAVVGLVVVATYMGETARRPLGEILVVGMIGLSGVVDILQRINAGAASGQAVETVAIVLLAVLVCLTGISVPTGGAGRALGCVALFVIWTVISFTWGSVSTQGLQNVFVYVAAVLFMAIGATIAHHRGAAAHEIISRAFWVAATVGLGLYAISVAIAGPGTAKIISPRPFGLMGVVLVAWFVSGGLIGRRWSYWVVGFAVVLTLLSLSRSALAAEFALVALARFNLSNFRGWIIAAGAIAATLAIALSAVFFYAPLHHRFFHGDTQQVGGFSINVTGRDALWSANWGWFKEKPLIGFGAGASDRMTRGAARPRGRPPAQRLPAHPGRLRPRRLRAVDERLPGAAAADVEALAGGAGVACVRRAGACGGLPRADRYRHRDDRRQPAHRAGADGAAGDPGRVLAGPAPDPARRRPADRAGGRRAGHGRALTRPGTA